MEGVAMQGRLEAMPRAFQPGQQMNVWLELVAAESGGGVNVDLFQASRQRMIPRSGWGHTVIKGNYGRALPHVQMLYHQGR